MPFKDPEKRRAYGREQARKKRENSPEEVRDYQKSWCKKNPEKARSYTRKWARANPDKVQANERLRAGDPARNAQKKAQARACMKRLRETQPDRVLNTLLKSKYGLTLEQYRELHVAQKDVCAICEQPESWVQRGKKSRLSVDHCATSGEVRGLLCSNCNNGLGRFMHEPERLFRAAVYLKQPPARPILGEV